MDLLGSLGTLATNVKNVTLPGVFAALAFALLLWPPLTYDRVPTVIDNHPDIAKLRLEANELKNDSDASFGKYLQQSDPACVVKEGAESYTFLTIPRARDRAQVAVKNQLTLDDIDRTFLKCIEEETALQGVDDQAIKNANALIATRTTERDAIDASYQKYIVALSPMEGEFKERLESKEAEIAVLQAHALNFQRVQNERTRRVAELQRVDGEMKARLADAGRLRPIQKFDDILSGLSTHIVGFLTLVFAWGLLVDPINRAIFGFVYDAGFDDEWDELRPVRKSPGQDAFDAWSGTRKPGSSAEPVGSRATTTSRGSDRRNTNRFFAEVTRWRGNPWLSFLVIVICLVLGALVICACAPGSTFPATTATIVCLSDNDVPVPECKSGKVSATVMVPGSYDIPTGKVKFFDGDTPLGDPVDLDPHGKACTTLDPEKLHTLSATYEGTSNLQSSRSESLVLPIAPSMPPAQHRSAFNLDLSHLPMPAFGHNFVDCFIVMVLAWTVGYFLPGLLKPLSRSTPTNRAEPEPSHAKIEAFAAAVKAGDSEITVTDEPTPTSHLQPHTAKSSEQTPHDPEPQLARELVEDLANTLLEDLQNVPKSTTKEQELADKFVQGLAAGLVSNLKAMKLPSPSEQTSPEHSTSHSTSEQTPGPSKSHRSKPKPPEASKAPSASEQKLAEDLLKKLVDDLKKPTGDKPQPNDAQKLANELVQQLANDLVKDLAKSLTPEKPSKKPFTCQQKLARDWKKLSQPQYAIGQGLMLRSDFETLQNSYYSQSLISIGLIFPLFFLIFALLDTPQFGLGSVTLYLVLGVGEVVLLITGVDRRHKYTTELEGLISSAFLKTCAQNDKSTPDKSGTSVAKQISDALKAAEIMDKTNLKIIPADPPPAPASGSASTPAPAPSSATKPAPAKTDPPQKPGSPGKTSDSSSGGQT